MSNVHSKYLFRILLRLRLTKKKTKLNKIIRISSVLFLCLIWILFYHDVDWPVIQTSIWIHCVPYSQWVCKEISTQYARLISKVRKIMLHLGIIKFCRQSSTNLCFAMEKNAFDRVSGTSLGFVHDLVAMANYTE